MSAPTRDPHSRFRHRKDAVNGISLHSVVDGEGPAILLLHGWPQTWWEWRHMLPRLSEQHSTIAVDLRGFGDSSKPPPEAGYDVGTLCTDLCELLDAQGHVTATVIGHDLGGLVAYAMARLHPERVERLVLLDAPLPIYGLEVPAWAEIEKQLWHQRFHKVPWLPEALISGRERLYLSWHFAQGIQNPAAITERDIDEYVRAYSQPGGLASGFAFSRATETSAKQVTAVAREKMKIPLLFFGGATTLANAFEPHLGQVAESYRVEVVPESGHWMPEENPEFLLTKLRPFLAGGTSASRAGIGSARPGARSRTEH
jgi:pimeloyl-ACP methyl ester carboxylesterase